MLSTQITDLTDSRVGGVAGEVVGWAVEGHEVAFGGRAVAIAVDGVGVDVIGEGTGRGNIGEVVPVDVEGDACAVLCGDARDLASDGFAVLKDCLVGDATGLVGGERGGCE